ncbi:MAG: hypothetical protein KAQ75_17520 [Bacteroidales bacterium]|nr:hypothetical protein [Bacteroidales bacterium]
MKIVKYISISLVLAVFFMSCSDDSCRQETESFLKTEITVVDASLIALKFLDSLSIYSPDWTDSIHYLDEGTDNNLYFILSPNSDSTEIIFTSKSHPLNDTILFFHQSEIIFLSPECGFVINYKIDSLVSTSYNIDSLTLLKSNITSNGNGHLQIYF